MIEHTMDLDRERTFNCILRDAHKDAVALGAKPDDASDRSPKKKLRGSNEEMMNSILTRH